MKEFINEIESVYDECIRTSVNSISNQVDLVRAHKIFDAVIEIAYIANMQNQNATHTIQIDPK